MIEVFVVLDELHVSGGGGGGGGYMAVRQSACDTLIP